MIGKRNRVLLCADRVTLQQMLSLQKDLMCRLSSAGVKDTQGHPSAANSDLYRRICAELVSSFLDQFSRKCGYNLSFCFFRHIPE